MAMKLRKHNCAHFSDGHPMDGLKRKENFSNAFPHKTGSQNTPLITVFTSKNKLAKRMDHEGNWLESEVMSKGQASIREIPDLETLAAQIESLTPHQAIGLGIMRNGRKRATIATKAALDKGRAPVNAIARGNESFELASSGFLLIDVDDDTSPEQVISHLAEFLLELGRARWLALASSRHHVIDPNGKTVYRKGGWHLYAQISEGLYNLPALAKTYEQWAQANGYATQELNAAGALCWKYPIDISVWKSAASRIIFETVLLPKGYRAERPVRWINPEGGPVALPVPAGEGSPARTQPSKKFASTNNIISKDKQQPHHEHLLPPAVAAYNAATDLKAALTKYGYRHHTDNKWSAPEQSGNSAGVTLYQGTPDKVHHFTTKGPLAGRSADAFDLLTVYEYNGDRQAALDACRLRYQPTDTTITARDNLTIMSPAAQQAWRDWLDSKDSRFLGRAALYDGVEQQISASQWAAERNRPELAPEILQALKHERRARWGGMHTTEEWREPLRCTSIDKAGERLRNTSASTFLQGPLGCGKTDKALRPLVMASSGPVLIINHLRALSNELASKMHAQHYQQEDPLRHDRSLVTTIHSLNTGTVLKWIQDANPQLILIDEAASVAGVLAQPGGNLSQAQQLRALDILRTQAIRGARIVMADGDLTPPARILADLLGVAAWLVAPSEFEQPAVQLVHATPCITVDEEGRKHRCDTSPLHDAIKSINELVLFCDIRSDVDAWHQLLPDLLPLHGDNCGEDRQAAFLDAPNATAMIERRICYSSLLGAGISITSVELPVFGCYTGHLAPHTTWQALRRFRRPSGGIIRIQVASRACKPRIQHAVTDEAELLAAVQELGGAGAVDSTVAAWQALQAAYYAMSNRWQQNPAAALLTYLEEAGIHVSVVIDGSGINDDDYKHAAQSSKAARIEALRNAPCVSDAEQSRLRNKPRRTLTEAAILHRANAERTLHISHIDHETDGTLPQSLAEAITCAKLENRAQLAAYLWRTPDSCAYQDSHSNSHQQIRQRLAAATLAYVGITPEASAEPGTAALTIADARAFIQQLDTLLPKRGRLILLHEMGLPQLPSKSARDSAVTIWQRDWLGGWGLKRVGRMDKRDAASNRITGSIWQIAPLVERFGQRIAAALNATHKAPQSHVSRGLQPTPILDEDNNLSDVERWASPRSNACHSQPIKEQHEQGNTKTETGASPQ